VWHCGKAAKASAVIADPPAPTRAYVGRNRSEGGRITMASYPATGPKSYKRGDGGSGAGVMILALFLGIAVGVLVIVSAVLIKMTDDARDDVNATATSVPAVHDHASQASSSVSLPLQSFAGVTGDNAEELAKAHAATNAALPAVPAGNLVSVRMTLKDMVV